MSKPTTLLLGTVAGHLPLAPVSLPHGAYDDAVAILGRRGRGKTVTAATVIEGLHKLGRRFCIMDPTGAWHGLRSSADGKSPGLPVIVMGGDHGDVPLEAGSGKVIATFVANPRNPSTVLDLSGFDDADAERFNNDFLRHLYRINRHRLHPVFDECQFIAPENPDSPAANKMKKAAGKVFQMGRQHGLLPILISPRPSSVSKDCLYACGTMVVHTISAPADQDSLKKWVKNAGTPEQVAEFNTSLSKLPVGTAWVWSPDTDIFRKVQVKMRETFDSSKTAGGSTKVPKVRADVDLDALKASIADTIAKADAQDPVKLATIISQLRGELSAAGRVLEQLKANQIPDKIVVATGPHDTLPVLSIYKDDKGVLTVDVEMPAPPKAEVKVKEIKVPVFKNGDAARIEKAARDVLGSIEGFKELCVPLTETVAKAEAMVADSKEAVAQASHPMFQDLVPGKPEYKPPMPFKASAPLKAGTTILAPGAVLTVGGGGRPGTHTPLHEGITVPELTILTSICQFHMIGNAAPRRVAAAALAGYTAGGGRFRNLLGGLRGKGLVDYPGDDRVSLTPAGQALVPKSSQVRAITQADMYAKVGQLLKESERKVMEAVIRAPMPLTREQLAQDSGYDMKGGRFRNILGTLRSMDFISYPEEGMVHVSQGLRVGA